MACLLFSCILPVLAQASESELEQQLRHIEESLPEGCQQLDIRQTIRSRFTGNRLSSADIEELEGMTIRAIGFLQVGVFDEENPDENNSLYRFLNKIHINTKEYVVAPQLLFEEGDSLNANIILETERLLRTRGYFYTAFIVPHVICNGQVDLVVVTRDSWSLEVEASFSHSGGDSSSGFGFSDGNIFGSGNSFSIGYEQENESKGMNYTFRSDHFLNSRVATRISYADKSDGEDTVVEAKLPFYSRSTVWAGGAAYRDTGENEIIRAKGEEISRFRHEKVYQEAYVGRLLHTNKNSTQRILLGLASEDDTFYENDGTFLGIPDARGAQYPWVEYRYLEDHYAVYRNLNQIQRTEDVAMGITFDFRLGYGKASPAEHGDLIRYIGNYQQIIGVGDDHLLILNVSVDGRDHLDSDGHDSAIWRTKAAYNIMQDVNNRWYASIGYDAGQDLEQYEELTVGGSAGMRGYPADFQRGKKRMIATVERRYYSDWHLFNLVRVGAVGFVEAGKAWDGPIQDNNKVLADVGFGLRFSSSKARVGSVVHVDISTPLVAKDGIDKYQLIIEAKRQF
ncbi:BamA/TamA family outer membrane protein [Gilvimarinus polysaccharolyticus]|uniref:hypothetical protein n=1 Tax=Gilvimarinus polysaccharolyticus TaxID=863921 RepID=UPI0012FBB8E1|nr:hypothetical protein [Gilvimarinus polysaccharolyticus]